jgi:ubiquinone/menaquinone biosynthesis C-methylase UbiE
MLRHREPEWMDEATADPRELRRSLVFIERVNRYLRYTSALIQHLEKLSVSWEPGKTITLLDIATGSGDVPRAIMSWGQRRGFVLRITGIDRHEATLQLARESTSDDAVQFVRADALELTFANDSFDYVICSMFLHHLSDEEAIKVISSANRIARRGFLIADLLRSRRALAWITLFTMFSNPMVKHDARVSVKQAYTPSEMLKLCGRAGVTGVRCHRHFGHRLILAKEKC